METTTLPAAGTLRIIRTEAGRTLVCINDLLKRLETPGSTRSLAYRFPAEHKAKRLENRVALHFYDIPSAVVVISASRRRPHSAAVAVVRDLIAIEAGAFDVDAPPPLDPAVAAENARFVQPGRPTGVTVREAIEGMGLQADIAATHAGVYVAEHYDGEWTPWLRLGRIYADEEQVRRILDRYQRERRAKAG